MSSAERTIERLSKRLSWSHIPKSEISEFSPEEPLQLNLLVKASENMRDDPELSINQAVSAGINTLYGEIKKKKILFTDISSPVDTYLNEFPGMLEYIIELRDTEAINENGQLKRNMDEVPTFETFMSKRTPVWKGKSYLFYD